MFSSAVITVSGTVGKSELKTVGADQKVLKFSVAVNKGVKKDGAWSDATRWYQVEIWGKQAETVNKFLLKGSKVSVSGEHDVEEYTDNEGKTQVKQVIKNVGYGQIAIMDKKGDKPAAPAYDPKPAAEIDESSIPF